MGYLRAGPRKHCYFKPDEVRAAVVTCGGICPGLNTVVRELVCCLEKQYGVKHIWGVPSGCVASCAARACARCLCALLVRVAALRVRVA